MDVKKIGNFIKETRKEKGYKQKDLAEILHVSDKTISRWETGNGMPEIGMLIPLSEALGVSLNQLLSGEKEVISENELLNDTIQYSMEQINDQKRNDRQKILSYVLIFMGLILIIGLFQIGSYLYTQRHFTAEQLGIESYVSQNDTNHNGVADNEDIVEGARMYIESKPHYESHYYAGGYPNDGCGVSADLFWKSLYHAGYDFKELLDEDVKNNPLAYPHIETIDPNIDFRRVVNIHTYLERYAQKLPILLDNPNVFQPGDILIAHEKIMICSDVYNADGYPFVFIFDENGAREVNAIQKSSLIGHYRFELEF